MRRPSRIAPRIVAKLSSASTISAASFVASVPLMPIAMPTLARVSAGASFTPSPVIATTSPCACSARTMRILCSGLVRAYTSTSRTTALSWSCESASSSAPVSTAASSPSTRPISRAIAIAVPAWSPVIIFTRMPAAWQSAIASIASGRGGSRMPQTPRNSRPSRSSSSTSPALGVDGQPCGGQHPQPLAAQVGDHGLPEHDVERGAARRSRAATSTARAAGPVRP